MNTLYDYNGNLVKPSQPVKQIQRIKYDLTIDSRDRDPTKFLKVVGGASSSDPGDYVVYLPRVYENVCSIRLKSATIQSPESGLSSSDFYIMIDIEGLNKIDETAPAADRSGHINSSFAKIPIDTNTLAGSSVTAASSAGAGPYIITYTTAAVHAFSVGQTVTVSGLTPSGYNVVNATITGVPSTTSFQVTVTTDPGVNTDGTGTAVITAPYYYNDMSNEQNIHEYRPPIGKLDRMHITLRRHKPFSEITTTSPNFAPITFGSAENTLRFEIETIENVFTGTSSFETRLSSRTDYGHFGC